MAATDADNAEMWRANRYQRNWLLFTTACKRACDRA